MTQSKIYQVQYQKALKAQIEGIMEKLHGDNYTSVQQYLNECYKKSFGRHDVRAARAGYASPCTH